MRMVFMRGGVVLSLLAALALFAGCSGGKDPKEKSEVKTKKDDDHKDHKDDDHKEHKQAKKEKEKVEDDHTSDDGFWCISHGIPELECSMCQAKVEKECKAKGDWCEKHNRAQSQCFICNPKLKAAFDKKYRTRYGKEPPLTDDEKEAKKEKDKK